LPARSERLQKESEVGLPLSERQLRRLKEIRERNRPDLPKAAVHWGGLSRMSLAPRATRPPRDKADSTPCRGRRASTSARLTRKRERYCCRSGRNWNDCARASAPELALAPYQQRHPPSKLAGPAQSAQLLAPMKMAGVGMVRFVSSSFLGRSMYLAMGVGSSASRPGCVTVRHSSYARRAACRGGTSLSFLRCPSSLVVASTEPSSRLVRPGYRALREGVVLGR
jgi:hypothetical protein